jgi:hypothetical protein
MYRNHFKLWFASLAVASLVGPASAVVGAQASKSAPDGAYDWKASFAKVKTGKVPRMPDGKPDLQGIWSRSILTPMERPANAKDKTEIDASAVSKAEDEIGRAHV